MAGTTTAVGYSGTHRPTPSPCKEAVEDFSVVVAVFLAASTNPHNKIPATVGEEADYSAVVAAGSLVGLITRNHKRTLKTPTLGASSVVVVVALAISTLVVGALR